MPPPRVFNVVRLIVQGACAAHGISRELAAEWLGISQKRLARALVRDRITNWGNIALFGRLLGLAPGDMVSLVAWTQVRVELEAYYGDDLADFPEIWSFVQEAAAAVGIRKGLKTPPKRAAVALDLGRRAAEGGLGFAVGQAPAARSAEPAAWVAAALDLPGIPPFAGQGRQADFERLARGLVDRARDLAEETHALRRLTLASLGAAGDGSR